jgi:hypothetical protein
VTDHNFTDEEVIKALECCKRGYCIEGKCPLLDWNDYDDISRCTGTLATIALDLINRQKAEIDRFAGIGKMYSEVRAEAIKEFAERLTNRIMDKLDASDNAPDGDFYFITDVYTDIDDLVKEMTEEKTNAK